jgi:hypothetical protein
VRNVGKRNVEQVPKVHISTYFVYSEDFVWELDEIEILSTYMTKFRFRHPTR